VCNGAAQHRLESGSLVRFVTIQPELGLDEQGKVRKSRSAIAILEHFRPG